MDERMDSPNNMLKHMSVWGRQTAVWCCDTKPIPFTTLLQERRIFQQP